MGTLAALAAVTYAPLRSRLQRLVDQALYRDRYDYGETLRQFSQELAALRSRDEILTTLVDRVSSTLNLSFAAAVGLPEGIDTRALALVEEADLVLRGPATNTSTRAEIVAALATVDLPRWRLSGDRRVLLDPWPRCAALVLVGAEAAGHGGALLVLGVKQTGAKLRATDRALLETVSHQAAAALSNAALVEGLRTSLAQLHLSTSQLAAARAEQQLLLRQLVDSEERQRAALAHDLHDDALQEVLYVVRHSRLAAGLAQALHAEREAVTLPVENPGAEGTRGALASEPKASRLRQELLYLAERATIAEQRLRSLCMGLYPALLTSVGLIGAIQELVTEISATGDADVTVTADDDATALASRLDLDATLHVYRIVQEALRNSAKHAGASAVRVRLWAEMAQPSHGSTGAPGAPHTTPYLGVDIEDNGVGMPAPVDYATLLREGHLGLAGMRQRADRIGATIDILPATAAGTVVSLHVPVAPTGTGDVLR